MKSHQEFIFRFCIKKKEKNTENYLQRVKLMGVGRETLGTYIH